MKAGAKTMQGSVHLPEPEVGDMVRFILPSRNSEIGLLLSINPGTGLGRVLWSGSNLIERHSLHLLRKVINEGG